MNCDVIFKAMFLRLCFEDAAVKRLRISWSACFVVGLDNSTFDRPADCKQGRWRKDVKEGKK